jgi:uncharacterized protein (DUF1501 family)
MVVPYGNPGYYQRRPSIAVPQGNVLQVGADTGGTNIGLHPRLQGMKRIFDDGRLAVIQRSGYPNSSRSHFQGTDIWSTADPSNPSGPGWLGRYLELMPQPVDPLTGWNTVRETPRTLLSRFVGVPAIPDPRTYAFSSPNTGNEALFARQAATRIASHVPVDRPHLSFVSATSRAAFETLDRVASVAAYTPTVTYPTTGLGSALRAVAGAMVRSIGTKVFWVQTGGFDTHASQDPNNVNGAYYRLMATMDDALLAFYTDLRNHGLLNDSLVLQFSEFGRRVYENGSQGTDHGAASSMMVMGGGVNGGLYGTAPDLRDTPGNPTLESNNGDVRFQTDFRSVYARVLDQWLGAPSTTILEGDFRQPGLTFL